MEPLRRYNRRHGDDSRSRHAHRNARATRATIDRAKDRAVGSTRYLEIRPADRGIEIGSTWLGAESQRTAINTEAKYLLLRHAFETLGALRVQLKTDRRNEKSQKAIERLGAVREGILRKQVVTWNGYVRDSVYFSITDDEWPSVRARLEGWLRAEPRSQAIARRRRDVSSSSAVIATMPPPNATAKRASTADASTPPMSPPSGSRFQQSA